MDEEEEVVIVVRRVQQPPQEGSVTNPPRETEITRTFSGFDRFKKAKKFLTALQD